ncbi:unnamed protein product [Euphydryas editha]|uniref:Cystatin domain-containing protein n=1 Tax=Euphydryas editha TaxID=104508 RepID=A0AAU9U633_EUPED|nr:unnamed protein product [Euphydryas editha]
MLRFSVFALFFCLSIACCLAEENSVAEVKNAGPDCYGCEINVNPNRPIYREMAQEALKVYLRRVGSHRLHQVVQVERVTQQVVAGEITRVTFSAVPSNCNTKDLVQSVDWSNLLLCKSEHLKLLSSKSEIKVSCQHILL